MLGLLLIFNLSFAANSQVLSFRDWKQQQVQEAEAIVKRIKSSPKKESYTEDLYRSLLSLEMTKDLTVNDYFIVYLANHKDGKRAFQIAVQKMSPAENATLLWNLKPHQETFEKTSASK